MMTTSPYRPIAGLLLGATLLFVGQGVFLFVTPLRLAAEQASATALSVVGSAYFLGIVCGAWFSDRIVRSIGNVRAYGGFIAIIIAAAASLTLVDGAPAWAGLRFLHGWAAAGTFLAIESWLNAATPDAWRGRVIGGYIALSLLGLGAGLLLAGAYGAAAPQTAAAGLALFATSIVPVVLAKTDAPPIAPVAPRSPLEVYRHSPLAAAGCVAGGLCMGGFWALGPAYAAAYVDAPREASWFMAGAIFGGLAFVWPLGRISDQAGRRTVIAAAAVIGGAISVAGALIVDVGGARLLLPIGLLYGGIIFALYPLSVSHAADHLGPGEDMLAMTRGLLLASNLGQALGPLGAGLAMSAAGARGFFIVPAATLTVLAAAAVWRIMRRAPPPPERRKPFAALPDVGPAGLALDPRIAERP
jgi:MFS family permease